MMMTKRQLDVAENAQLNIINKPLQNKYAHLYITNKTTQTFLFSNRRWCDVVCFFLCIYPRRDGQAEWAWVTWKVPG